MLTCTSRAPVRLQILARRCGSRALIGNAASGSPATASCLTSPMQLTTMVGLTRAKRSSRESLFSTSTPVTTSTSTAKTQNGQSSTNAATTTDAASQSAQAASADASQNASGTPVMQVAAIATDQPVSGLSFNVMLPLAIAVGVSVVTAAALLMWIRPRELDQPTLGKK